MKTVKRHKAFGGTLSVLSHDSSALSCPMEFAVFVPGGDGPFACLWYLSGLTCTWANAAEKGGILKAAAEAGTMFTHVQTLDETHLGSFEHDDHERFFPDRAQVESWAVDPEA